ncbi:hypothetical protein [Mycobacterium sp. URHB0044]|uniref:hypothetical protein n=1 Tax=Mycobacterium sp. URHB0044 TaxID=1380386 RepID=UPI0012DC8432|nr:hypothetical protein [Mycobacterium sp. URHB0044]
MPGGENSLSVIGTRAMPIVGCVWTSATTSGWHGVWPHRSGFSFSGHSPDFQVHLYLPFAAEAPALGGRPPAHASADSSARKAVDNLDSGVRRAPYRHVDQATDPGEFINWTISEVTIFGLLWGFGEHLACFQLARRHFAGQNAGFDCL